MQIQSLRNEPGWDVRKCSLRKKKLRKEGDSVISFAAVISVVTQRSSPLRDLIHKWWLFYFCSVIAQIRLPSLALEQEFFLI